MQRYGAQEQFKKATQSAKSMPDVVILQKLQTAADQEREQSRIESEKQWGQPVKYGTTMIQVIPFCMYLSTVLLLYGYLIFLNC